AGGGLAGPAAPAPPEAGPRWSPAQPPPPGSAGAAAGPAAGRPALSAPATTGAAIGAPPGKDDPAPAAPGQPPALRGIGVAPASCPSVILPGLLPQLCRSLSVCPRLLTALGRGSGPPRAGHAYYHDCQTYDPPLSSPAATVSGLDLIVRR